jgi:hypothetical protein
MWIVNSIWSWNTGTTTAIVCVASLTISNVPVATLTTIYVSVTSLTGVNIFGSRRVLLLVRRITDIVALWWWWRLGVIVTLCRRLRVRVHLRRRLRVIEALWGRVRVRVHLPTCWLRIVHVIVVATVVGVVGCCCWVVLVVVRGSIRVGTRFGQSCWYARRHDGSTSTTAVLSSLWLYSVSHWLDSSFVVALQVTIGLF